MLVVQKFGGSSLADTSRIRRAAARIATLRQQGHQVVAVVSAMEREVYRTCVLYATGSVLVINSSRWAWRVSDETDMA